MRPTLPPFRVKARSFGFRRGIDVLRLNQLYDELEAEDFQRKLTQLRRQLMTFAEARGYLTDDDVFRDVS